MEKTKRRFRFAIKWKAITMIVALAIIVIEISVAYYSIMMSKVNRETYSKVAKDISASVAEVVDVEEFKYVKDKVSTIVTNSPTKPIAEEATEEELETYLAQFDDLKNDPVYVASFNKNLEKLRKLQETNTDFIDCIYLTYVDATNELFVYLIDAATEDACPAGLIDPIYEFNQKIFTDPTIGFPPYVTNTDMYGWLITAGAPIYEGDNVIGYAMADISMYTVRKTQANSIVRMFLYMLASLVLVGVLGVIWVSFWMIRPLKKLTNLAESYDGSDPKGTHERFQNFENKTRDEITDLTESIKIMEKDVYDRFNALVDTNRQLINSKEETKKLTILANQDGLTGVHNKISYNNEVSRIDNQINNKEEIEFAVVMVDLNFLKDINDVHGHDDGDMAIIKLTKLICEVFTLSPVYRVGGDEFVVICRGKDYNRISHLINNFKKRISETHHKEIHDSNHISAAIGYSIFNKSKDKCVNDVFKRADKAMYENKREIKQGK